MGANASSTHHHYPHRQIRRRRAWTTTAATRPQHREPAQKMLTEFDVKQMWLNRHRAGTVAEMRTHDSDEKSETISPFPLRKKISDATSDDSGVGGSPVASNLYLMEEESSPDSEEKIQKTKKTRAILKRMLRRKRTFAENRKRSKSLGNYDEIHCFWSPRGRKTTVNFLIFSIFGLISFCSS